MHKLIIAEYVLDKTILEWAVWHATELEEW